MKSFCYINGLFSYELLILPVRGLIKKARQYNTIYKERGALLMRASTFFLGLATGAVAAAVTVLYSTPQSGNEFRSSVKNASTDLKETFNDAKEKISKLNGSVANLAKEVKDGIPETVDGLKQSFENWQEATEPNKKRLEKELAAIQEALDSLEQSIIAQQKQ